MARRLLPVILCLLAGWARGDETTWRVALPGWKYEFPRDHGNHPEFKTEWWYFTGNLTATDRREFGYQLTFFRQGIRPDDIIPLSRFVTRDIKFAHFAVSDVRDEKFRFFQKLSRGAYGEAGFDQRSRMAWIENWSCERLGDNEFQLQAKNGDAELTLRLKSLKSPVIHGADGVSQKGNGEGRASHYYSLTRLASEGTLRIADKTYAVAGQSWFDHEWATNQLAATQAGWDWFSLQFDDGSELMLFQLRLKAGGRDAHSAGTFIDSQGAVTPIAEADFTLEPQAPWKSPQTGATYPTVWRLRLPKLHFSAEVRAAFKAQELHFDSISYWEGAVRANASLGEQKIKGSGYLEMTGYAGAITGLQSSP